ncbi:MAG: GGDEF domain-containing protein [Actinobacteria bacterium]|nr:GGDEF domain-containing protein [Actinomycetota bacterium]
MRAERSAAAARTDLDPFAPPLHSRATAERLRLAFDGLPDPYLIATAARDQTGRIVDFRCVDANRAACEQIGSDLDDVLDRDVLDLVPDIDCAALHADCVRMVDEATRTGVFVPISADIPGADGRWFDVRVSTAGDGISVTWRDVSARRGSLHEVSRSERRFRLLAENASDLVYFADAAGRATWVAPTVTRSLGWSVDELIGSVITDLVHPDDWDVVAAIREVAATGDDVIALQPGAEHPVIARMRQRDGAYRWMSVSATRVHEQGSHSNSVVVGMRDVDELVHTQRLAERGTRDDLTGLVNRLSLIERMEQLLAESRRNGDQHAVLYCDVDYFKEINDTYGHAIGDDVLRRIATRIRSSVRERDVVARLGGDEFVVVLHGVRGPGDAEIVAEKIRSAMSEPLLVDGIDLACSFSIGVAMVRPDSTPDRVLRDADAALYEAKEAGRDRTVTHRQVATGT